MLQRNCIIEILRPKKTRQDEMFHQSVKTEYRYQFIKNKTLYLKSEKGYIETFPLFDFMTGNYKLKVNGQILKFKKAPDIKRIEKEETEREMEECYGENSKSSPKISSMNQRMRAKAGLTVKNERVLELFHNGNDVDEIAEQFKTTKAVVKSCLVKNGIIKKGACDMLKMTKKEVLKMNEEGMTVQQIVDHFIEGNEKSRPMYTAKATLFINGPKEKEKVAKELFSDVETILDEPKPVSKLKIRLIEDEDVGFNFNLRDNSLVISYEVEGISIPWERLSRFIDNLVEVERIYKGEK